MFQQQRADAFNIPVAANAKPDYSYLSAEKNTLQIIGIDSFLFL
ncbi:hypothetical protein [Nostoc sp.]